MAERRVGRYVPDRVARVIGIAVAITLFTLIIDGVLFKSFIRMADYSFKTLDALLEPDIAPPTDPNGTGSAESLIDWEELGRAGREFVSSGPTREDLTAFLGRDGVAADSRLRRPQLGRRRSRPARNSRSTN